VPAYVGANTFSRIDARHGAHRGERRRCRADIGSAAASPDWSALQYWLAGDRPARRGEGKISKSVIERPCLGRRKSILRSCWTSTVVSSKGIHDAPLRLLGTALSRWLKTSQLTVDSVKDRTAQSSVCPITSTVA
jgi:hypothetical protein